jgi:hypothetical protein
VRVRVFVCTCVFVSVREFILCANVSSGIDGLDVLVRDEKGTDKELCTFVCICLV